MKLLVIGSGGREHALVWKLSQSPQVTTIYVAPGNAGTMAESKAQNVNIEATAITDLCTFALENSIDLTIVGPEAPLALGITDLFEQHGLACLGPNKAAAQLETSKVFAKTFLTQYQIPTASYAAFTDFTSAVEYAQAQSYPIVIKADGLAAGKGVIICQMNKDLYHLCLA